MADRKRRGTLCAMRRVLPLALLCASTAAADPAATLSVDVDGDGRADQLAVEAPGQLVVARGGGGGQLVPFARSGELTEARLSFAARPTPTVVASARLGGAWEAVALTGGKGGLVELWRGPVGPAGDDDEYEQWVEARSEGLLRFQTRADQRRCDGVPLELFVERWDARARRFALAPRPRLTPPADAPVVTATPVRDAPPLSWYRAVASSTAAGAVDASMLVTPSTLGDGDPGTAWTADDDGHGTWWQFRSSLRGGQAAAIRVVPGAGGPRRAARLWVVGARGQAVIAIPASKDPRAVFQATLPSTIDGCVSIALLDTHPGRGATAVPELAVVADVELDPAAAERALVAQVVAGGLAADTAGRALVARGPSVIAPILAARDGAPDAARQRLLGLLAELDDAAVAAPLTAALAAGELTADRRGPAAARVARLGPEARAGLAAIIGGPGDRDGQLAAVAALADDPAALAARVGAGDREVRLAVTQALARLPLPELIAAARAPGEPAVRADRWRAVGLAATAAALEARAPAVAALVAALDDTGPSYELRYRTIAALAPIADDAAVARLAGYLAALPDSAAGRALARVGVRGLGDNPRAAAALAGLAVHRDPGVRREALRGLATVDGGDDAVLTAAVTADAWPMNRQQAAATLGGRCARAPVRDALWGVVDADDDTAVRVEAVAAVARCPDATVDARLWTVVDDGKQRLPVRDRALAALAERPAVTEALLTRFNRWRSAAFSDDTALRLAIRAATALGQRGAREAGPALLAAARDRAFPELTAAAVRALGPVCPPEAPALLRSLLTADDAAIAVAARAAARECR